MSDPRPIFEQAGLSPDLAARLAAATADDDLWNDPRQFERRLHDQLADLDWAWPWHEEWQARFAALGAYPVMWTRKGRHDQRVKLLAHSAMFIRSRIARIEQGTYTGWCQFRIGRDEPEPILALQRELVAGYADEGGSADLPPYFPGDRTGWGFALPPKYHKPGGIYCPYRGPIKVAEPLRRPARFDILARLRQFLRRS